MISFRKSRVYSVRLFRFGMSVAWLSAQTAQKGDCPKDHRTDRTAEHPNVSEQAIDRRIAGDRLVIAADGFDYSEQCLGGLAFAPLLAVAAKQKRSILIYFQTTVQDECAIGSPVKEDFASARLAPLGRNEQYTVSHVMEKGNHADACDRQRERNAVFQICSKMREQFFCRHRRARSDDRRILHGGICSFPWALRMFLPYMIAILGRFVKRCTDSSENFASIC